MTSGILFTNKQQNARAEVHEVAVQGLSLEFWGLLLLAFGIAMGVAASMAVYIAG